MKIPSANSLFQSLSVTKTGVEQLNWKPGQLLQATVLSTLANKVATIRVGVMILTAEFNALVKAGDKLTLEVISMGAKPQLQSIQTQQIQQLVEAAIRQTLPKQQSLAQLVKHIEVFIQQKQLADLPANVQSALRNLYQSFPDRPAMSRADGVRQAFLNSGLFMEARLSNKAPALPVNLTQDIKAGLLRLQQALQQHLPAQSPTNNNQPVAPVRQTYAPVTPTSVNPTTPQATPAPSTNSPAPAAINAAPIVSTPLQTIANPTIVKVPETPLRQTTVTEPNTATRTKDSSSARTSPANNQPIPSALQSALRAMAIPAPYLSPSMNNPGLATELQLNPSYSTYVHPAHIAFRLNIEAMEQRPSARFSKMDNLSKILALFLKDADSSLSRVQLNQLSQHHVENDQKQAWLFEIPVKHKESIDLFKFRVEKDQENNKENEDDEENGWTVIINFNMEQLGQVHTQISIHNKQVSVIFWTEQQDTTIAFQDHMQTLQHDLEDSGLVVRHLNCIHGQPPEAHNSLISKNVIDDKA